MSVAISKRSDKHMVPGTVMKIMADVTTKMNADTEPVTDERDSCRQATGIPGELDTLSPLAMYILSRG